MRKIFALLALPLLIGTTSTLTSSAQSSEDTSTPELSLQKLKDGNERFVKEMLRHPNDTAARRVETAKMGQHPYATVLTCADSRVPVELVFDAGIGDIFVNRIAGNIVTPEMAGSIEYGVEHLHTPVLVILGHTGCGAVTAAAEQGEHSPNIEQLLKPIAPVIKEVKKDNPGKEASDLIEEAVKENVLMSIRDLLQTSGITRNLVRDKKLRIEAAIYDIGSGEVKWHGQHPDQASMLNATYTDDRHLGKTPEVAIIINDTNPAENIGMTMLEMIFAGDVANWIVANGDDRPIQLVGPKRDNSAYATFTNLVLEERPMAPEYFDLPTDVQVLEEVANEPGSIAFIRYPYTEMDGIKLLPVHSRLPGTYKYPLNPELLEEDKAPESDTQQKEPSPKTADEAHTKHSEKEEKTAPSEAPNSSHSTITEKPDMTEKPDTTEETGKTKDADKTESKKEEASDKHSTQGEHTATVDKSTHNQSEPEANPNVRTRLSDHPAHVETD